MELGADAPLAQATRLGVAQGPREPTATLGSAGDWSHTP